MIHTQVLVSFAWSLEIQIAWCSSKNCCDLLTAQHINVRLEVWCFCDIQGDVG
jgi:hypothetical protein